MRPTSGRSRPTFGRSPTTVGRLRLLLRRVRPRLQLRPILANFSDLTIEAASTKSGACFRQASIATLATYTNTRGGANETPTRGLNPMCSETVMDACAVHGLLCCTSIGRTHAQLRGRALPYPTCEVCARMRTRACGCATYVWRQSVRTHATVS